MDGTRPIIIKKKATHAAHHGGAWKVAYADFVTAMMALFIVLWLVNASKPIKDAIAGYFNDPSGTASKIGLTEKGVIDSSTITDDDMPRLKEQLEKAIRNVKDFDKFRDQIKITITSEGLRIELLESVAGTFFDVGNPKPNENGMKLLALLAHELGKLPNKILIEGHTDSTPYAGTRDYGNWDLSTDRANAARRLMQQKGLGPRQVSQVRGYADQLLRKPDQPLDASNRRISMIVQYKEKEDPGVGSTGSDTQSLPGVAPKKNDHPTETILN